MPTASAKPRSTFHVRAKRRRRRMEILHAALQAFRARGYHGTTLDDIAERLDLRKPALYRYFPDKEALLYACHREGLDEVAHIIADAARQPTCRERLTYAIREHVRVMADTLEGSSLAFETSALTPRHRADVIAARDRYEEALRALVRDGIDAGEFRPVDPKIAVFAILGAINWVARWYSPGGFVRPPELGAEFADHLTRGLLV